MQRIDSPRTLSLIIVAVVLAVSVTALTVTAVFAMSRGDWSAGWGMGSGHMGRMMGGGTNSSNAPLTAGTKAESVSIRDFAFAPGNLQIPVGATVTWTNYDDVPHTATAKDGSWDTAILNKGEKKDITFDKAGEFEYFCKVHPNMVARLTVR
jgi:plastocyanin